jgi:serine/threonine-protein kinase RsbW
MIAAEHRIFEARLAMLAETTAFVESFCRGHGIAHADALRLTLIVEELFTNTVTHGHGGDCDAPIGILLSADAGEVSLVYEDTAPRYDPLAGFSEPPSALDADVEARPIGGLGVFLVGQLVHDARYAYEEDRNRLWLRVRCTIES